MLLYKILMHTSKIIKFPYCWNWVLKLYGIVGLTTEFAKSCYTSFGSPIQVSRATYFQYSVTSHPQSSHYSAPLQLCKYSCWVKYFFVYFYCADCNLIGLCLHSLHEWTGAPAFFIKPQAGLSPWKERAVIVLCMFRNASAFNAHTFSLNNITKI